MNPKPSLLREAARQRLEHLNEVTPEQLQAEIEQARKEGYKLICLPGFRIRIRDYSLKAPEEMGNDDLTAGDRYYESRISPRRSCCRRRPRTSPASVEAEHLALEIARLPDGDVPLLEGSTPDRST